MRLFRIQSLRQRVALHVGLLAATSLLISISALIGMERLRNDLSVALRGYAEIRTIYDAGLNLSVASMAIRHEPPMLDETLRQLELARGKVTQSTFIATPQQPGMSPDWTNEHDRNSCLAELGNATDWVRTAIDHSSDPASLATARHGVATAIDAMAQATVHARNDVADRQDAADAKRRSTLAAVGVLSLILVAAAVLLAVRQYRSVMTPLDQLTATVRAFAGGKLSERNEPVGDLEFTALARDFNRMAAELESFYLDLQKKVATQSRELARSQRLASVGFLAAGVSHEINNPLGIISGYAERTLRVLDRPIDENDPQAMWAQTRKAMMIICEEAFRCKAITTRLLTLAHPGGGTMTRISLVAVARQVMGNLAGLPEYADRRMILETPDGPSECFIRAREGEMQQVVLNLTLNALQAITAPDGLVLLIARSIDDNSRVEFAVTDNGVGMDDETLERIFAPFYSQSTPRRTEGRAEGRGTGLGLSITHAIVKEHGGRIVAESDGLGRGSRFVVIFPAATAHGEVGTEAAHERI